MRHVAGAIELFTVPKEDSIVWVAEGDIEMVFEALANVAEQLIERVEHHHQRRTTVENAVIYANFSVPTADLIGFLKHGDFVAKVSEAKRGGEATQTRANDDEPL